MALRVLAGFGSIIISRNEPVTRNAIHLDRPFPIPMCYIYDVRSCRHVYKSTGGSNSEKMTKPKKTAR